MKDRITELRDAFFGAERAADMERALLVTESYKQNESKSEPMKKALALKSVMEHMTIAIHKNELIVGCHAQRVRSTPLFPEYAAGWISRQMDDFSTRPGDRFAITKEQKAELRNCLKYWEGRALDERIEACIPKELTHILDFGVVYNASYASKSPGHLVPDYEYLLNTGFERMIAICEDKLAALDMEKDDYVEKREFYLSCTESMKAVILYAHRFSKLAKQKRKRIR